MKNKLPSILDVFSSQAAMHRRRFRLMVIMVTLMFSAEMGLCNDYWQNPQSGVTVSYIEKNSPSISVRIIDEKEFDRIEMNSIPKPSPSKVAQQAVPPVTIAPSPIQENPPWIITQPSLAPETAGAANFYVNPPFNAASVPQMTTVPKIRLVNATQTESTKSDGQSNQPPLPIPEPEQLPLPPSIQSPAPQADSSSAPAAAIKPDQKLGEAPRDTSMEFLRQQTVLLKPCEWQMDVGFSYLVFDNHFADVTPQSELVDTRLRRRLLTMPLEVRYGLYKRVQLFANMPFGWANTELSRVGADAFANDGGIGDFNAGATIHLRESNGMSCSPDVLLTLGFTAPTGKGNALLGLFETPDITLGQGFWAGSWNVLWVHKYDPVVVFYGIGARHYCSRDVEDIQGAKPGDQYIYQLGTGYALNERITLSTIFFGSYVTEARVYDRVLRGTIQEPMYLRFATTITRPNHRICEPFAEIGLTDDSANARVGITWTF